MKVRWTLCFALLLFSLVGEAQEKQKGSKSLDFEGELVEGMNKQPLDSLSQLSERDSGRGKLHLYKKRTSYKNENLQTLRELTGQ